MDASALRDWYLAKRSKLEEDKKDEMPACWGGQYRVDDDFWVSQDCWESVFDNSDDMALFMLCQNEVGATGTVEDFAEIAEHAADAEWVVNRCDASVDDDAPCYYTEVMPDEYSPLELRDLVIEGGRRDLLDPEWLAADELFLSSEIENGLDVRTNEPLSAQAAELAQAVRESEKDLPDLETGR